MKAITLWQPWASLIAYKFKTYETRSWYANFRGEIAIHAAKRKVKKEEINNIIYCLNRQKLNDKNKEIESHERLVELLNNTEFPYGCVVAITHLEDYYLITEDHPDEKLKKYGLISIHNIDPVEKSCGYWEEGRYAWKFDNIKALSNPKYVNGKQSLWNLKI